MDGSLAKLIGILKTFKALLPAGTGATWLTVRLIWHQVPDPDPLSPLASNEDGDDENNENNAPRTTGRQAEGPTGVIEGPGNTAGDTDFGALSVSKTRERLSLGDTHDQQSGLRPNSSRRAIAKRTREEFSDDDLAEEEHEYSSIASNA
jgi:hypothetical protein